MTISRVCWPGLRKRSSASSWNGRRQSTSQSYQAPTREWWFTLYVSTLISIQKVSQHLLIMLPASSKLTGHIDFGLSVSVCVHPSVQQELCMHEISFLDSLWKNSWHTFFFLSKLSPFLEYYPFEKIRMKSDACHILWTMHARVLTFHIWIPHGKIADPFFFLVRWWVGDDE